MDESSKLTRLETLMEVVSADVKETRADVREIRRENEQWRAAHEKAVQDKLDHARRNNDQKFDALTRAIEAKVSTKDLEENQAKSDERWIEAKSMIDGKAGGWVEKVLAGFIALILTAVAGVWIKIAVIDEPRHAAAPVAQVAPQHPVEAAQPKV